MSFGNCPQLTFLNLKYVLGFCHGITKEGDCKVEFIQLFVGFYSVPNLLVIQHLETLYLGGNNVRVMCERVWRIDQGCASRGNSRLDLTTNLQVVTHQNVAHVWSMQKVEGLGQLNHYRTKSTVWPFCYLATGTRNSSQSWVTCQCTLFCWKMTFHIPSHTPL